MRSNIPLMSKYCYYRYDPEFSERARDMGSSIIIGGENYGQGSSREHAAINPMYLGVKYVIAKSIARIHKGNLVNHGIVPMLFEDPADYEKVDLRDELEIENFLDQTPTRRVAVSYTHLNDKREVFTDSGTWHFIKQAAERSKTAL